jgi:hypothetical protein
MNLSRRIKELEAQAGPLGEPRRTVIVTTASPSLPPPGLVAAFESDPDHSQSGMSALIFMWDGRALVPFEEWLKECQREHQAKIEQGSGHDLPTG